MFTILLREKKDFISTWDKSVWGIGKLCSPNKKTYNTEDFWGNFSNLISSVRTNKNQKPETMVFFGEASTDKMPKHKFRFVAVHQTKKITSEMEVAPHHTLLALLTLLI